MNEQSVAVFVGLDYHTSSVQVCVMDESGRSLANEACANDAGSIRGFAEGFGAVRGAALEACGGSADLAEELVQQGWNVSLAHAGYVAAMKSSPDKHDKGDAHLLADLRRLGYLPKVWLAPRPIRELRSLVRYRQQLADQRRQTKLRLTALLRERRVSRPGPRWTKAWLMWLERQADLGEHGNWIRNRHLQNLRRLAEEIRDVERRLEAATRDDPTVVRLLQEPGIGEVTAWTLRAEIGRFDRFHTGKQLARFCGLSPCNASSGRRQADAGLIRASNPQLRATLIELGQRLRRCASPYREMSQRLRQAGKPGSVIAAAVANRYMRRLFYRMTTAA